MVKKKSEDVEEFSKEHIEGVIKGLNKDRVVGKRIYEMDVKLGPKENRTSGKWLMSNSIYEDVMNAAKKLDTLPKYLVVSKNTFLTLNRTKYPTGFAYWWVISAIFGMVLGDPNMKDYIRVCDMPDDVVLLFGQTMEDVSLIEIS